MLAKPLFDDSGRAFGQQVDHGMRFEVDNDRPVGPSFAPGPVVYSNDRWGRSW
jgi:hypothetical protein